MKRVIGLATFAGLAVIHSASAQQLPPATAKAGECYAKVLIPAQYNTTSEEVMVQPAISTFKKTPAVFREVEKQVLVQEESYELVPVPPSAARPKDFVVPQEFIDHTVVPTNSKALDPAEIDAHRDRWIEEWTSRSWS